ncbi:hypothetical protein GCM10007067_06920 [Lysobacter bugurensis]|uniref:Uncharacterized protein n=1 Tax=Cognatilysobacter bugurensis TaxID=543356 RepID=A0A918SVF1_9GAMM|nr:hypothetical protein GCM10007067_06920 [Lysobacter bugurensis]
MIATAAAPVYAQGAPRLRPELRLCAPTGPCWLYPKRLVLPANALGRTPNLTPTMRGLDWPTANGYAQFAVPRPLDYTGGRVRVGVFYYIGAGGDGTVGVGMTPVGLRAGGPFETYGGGASSLAAVQSDTHYEQWVVLPTVNTGFSGSAPWWHVEINRLGTYDARITLLTVVVEYR